MATARNKSNVIESMELPHREGFVLSVQWHPEGLAKSFESHRNIFLSFIQSAVKYSNENKYGG